MGQGEGRSASEKEGMVPSPPLPLPSHHPLNSEFPLGWPRLCMPASSSVSFFYKSFCPQRRKRKAEEYSDNSCPILSSGALQCTPESALDLPGTEMVGGEVGVEQGWDRRSPPVS